MSSGFEVRVAGVGEKKKLILNSCGYIYFIYNILYIVH